jgi:hypothetical protein
MQQVQYAVVNCRERENGAEKSSRLTRTPSEYIQAIVVKQQYGSEKD